MSDFDKNYEKKICVHGDDLAIIDEIKHAEEQCDDLRNQLHLIYKVLSRDYSQVLSVKNAHRADASGEGNESQLTLNFTMPRKEKQLQNTQQVGFYEKRQIRSKMGQNEIEMDHREIKPSSQLHRDFNSSCIAHLAPVKTDKEVVTLFRKQGTSAQLLLTRSGDTNKKMPTTFTKNNSQQVKPVKKENVLPFIAGTSTSQSHNICLNFQEVLAKLKRQHPTDFDSIEECEENETVAIEKEKIQFGAGDSRLVHESKPEDQQQLSIGLSDDLRTQKFKDVLKNLYREFTSMTQEYEKLMRAYSSKEYNKAILKTQLKKLDSNLSQKEDEIVVLISMYRQVMSMKEEASRYNELAMQPQPRKQLSNTTNLRLKTLLQHIRKLQANIGQ